MSRREDNTKSAPSLTEHGQGIGNGLRAGTYTRQFFRKRVLAIIVLMLCCSGRAEAFVVGYLEGVDYDNGLTVASGWACDSGQSQSIAVHLYARDSSTGQFSFLTEAVANLYSDSAVASRCGTNASYYRYKVWIDQYQPVYAGQELWVFGISITGGDNNPLTNSGTMIIPDSIYGTMNGDPVQIRVSPQYGAAITSLKFRGQEFVNNHDHGRQFQLAAQFHGFGECYNPTEAGARSDDSTTSSSHILELSTYNNMLWTRSNPAFWIPPGQLSEYCTTTLLGDRVRPNAEAKNTTAVSNYEFRKFVEIGYAGISNVVHCYTQINVPTAQAESQTISSENLSGAGIQESPLSLTMPSTFQTFWKYDVYNKVWHPIDTSPSSQEQHWQILCTVAEIPDPNHVGEPGFGIAMGIYAPEIVSQPDNDNAWNHMVWGVGDLADPTSMSGLGFDYENPVAVPQGGMIQHDTYMVFGTRSEVEAGLCKLHAHFFGGTCP